MKEKNKSARLIRSRWALISLVTAWCRNITRVRKISRDVAAGWKETHGEKQVNVASSSNRFHHSPPLSSNLVKLSPLTLFSLPTRDANTTASLLRSLWCKHWSKIKSVSSTGIVNPVNNGENWSRGLVIALCVWSLTKTCSLPDCNPRKWASVTKLSVKISAFVDFGPLEH